MLAPPPAISGGKNIGLGHPRRSFLREWAAALTEFLLPAVCPCCQRHPGVSVCPACVGSMPVLASPCPWCAAPGFVLDCRVCRGQGHRHIAEITVGWEYAEGMRELVTRAKAQGRPAAVRACTELALMPALPPGTPVIPVPPSPGRRPGPHLATALARRIARETGGVFDPRLRPVRPAAEQHFLNQSERARNVDGLFAASAWPSPPALVCLVDDLLTSGATASAAAAALKAAGAKRVVLALLARTP